VADCTLTTWLRLRPALTPDAVLQKTSSATSTAPAMTTTALAALRRHIAVRERPRDATRAAHLESAIVVLDDLVDRAPDVDGLAELAGRLHGHDGPMPLRTTTAFAHGGRAVMGAFTCVAFDEVVRSAAGDDDGPPWFRAARLYADVCFFHPFDDGNARLALCALVHVLQRAGVGVVDLAPVVMPWTPTSVPALCRVVRAICRD